MMHNYFRFSLPDSKIKLYRLSIIYYIYCLSYVTDEGKSSRNKDMVTVNGLMDIYEKSSVNEVREISRH